MTNLGVSATRRLYWSVRRELWENRSVYLAPLIVAGLVLAGFSIALFTLPARMRVASTLSPPELRRAIEQPYVIAAIVLMAIDLLVAVFYCVEALYADRKDRSILFWKSLPVSDLTAVLAKACIPILVLPLVTFAATVATQGTMLLASSAVLAANGVSTAPLWTHLPFLEMSRINLAHLLFFHGFWYAPLYAWLLLASAWATRLPFLWATLPPVAIGVVERIAFNSTHFATLVQTHLLGGPVSSVEASQPPNGMTMEMLAPHSLAHFLLGGGLWGGLVVAGLFLLAAAQLRRYRGVI